MTDLSATRKSLYTQLVASTSMLISIRSRMAATPAARENTAVATAVIDELTAIIDVNLALLAKFKRLKNKT